MGLQKTFMDYGKVLLFALLVTSTIRISHTWSTGRNLVFNKLGKYEHKKFFIPKYAKTDWSQARRLCKDFGLEFARLEHLDEANYVINLVNTSPLITSDDITFMIDGVATTPAAGVKTGWFWVRSKHPIDYTTTWYAGQPDFTGGNEQCLSIFKKDGAAGFNDVPCSVATASFMCQTKHHKISNKS